MENENDVKPPGWKISLSIGFGVGWLIFFIIWLAFFAGDYSGYQNFAIFLISILVVFIILGGSWATWGLKFILKEGKEIMKITGTKTRIVVSIIVPLALMIFWIYWFFFIAENFNIYQNIAIFIVSLIAIGGLLGGLWAPWGMKHQKELDDIDKKDEKE